MPYKSRSQQRLFHHLVAQGKLAPEVAEEYDTASKGKKLPQFVKRKAFGGQIEAKSGTRCPACDYPLDAIPVALDAGEGCPRCGYGDAKDVPHKASGGEIQDVTAYRARGGEMQKYARRGEVEGKARASTQYKAKSADEFLKMLNAADARIKRMDAGLPYNPVPWHERTDEERKPIQMTADPTIPKRPAFGLRDAFLRREHYLDEGALGSAQEAYEEDPTPENAREITFAAKRLAKKDPNFSEEWRKNTSGRMGDLKLVDRYAHGGEVCEHCGSDMLADLKELYPSKKRRVLDDGKVRPFGQMFARALKTGRK
jgi:hypothetical protein